MRPPAFGKQLIQRRKLGERIGLVVIAVHDWDAGLDLAARSGTARLVVDIADMPHELDWSSVVALDCLVLGECDPSVFYAAATMVFAAGAASLWGDFQDGIWRLDRSTSRYAPTGFVAVDGPVVPARLGSALAHHRTWSLMASSGAYGAPVFDAAREAAYAQVFGAKAAQAQAFVTKQRNTIQARAA